MTTSLSVTSTLAIAPAQVVRGEGILSSQGEAIATLGQRPLVVGGQHSLPRVQPLIESLTQAGLAPPNRRLWPRL
jgi:glycerol dehydrogenase